MDSTVQWLSYLHDWAYLIADNRGRHRKARRIPPCVTLRFLSQRILHWQTKPESRTTQELINAAAGHDHCPIDGQSNGARPPTVCKQERSVKGIIPAFPINSTTFSLSHEPTAMIDPLLHGLLASCCVQACSGAASFAASVHISARVLHTQQQRASCLPDLPRALTVLYIDVGRHVSGMRRGPQSGSATPMLDQETELLWLQVGVGS
jgi:hypothetical protein